RLGKRRAERARRGPQRLQRRAELPRERVRLVERRLRRRERRRQQLERLADVRVLVRESAEVRVGRADELRELVVALAELVREQREVVDHAGQVLPPLREQPRDLREVAVGGLEALERLAQVRRVALLAERLAARVDEDLEVRARVAVEGGQHLVEVHVRRGVLDRDRAAVLE